METMTKERLEAYRSKKDEILELEYALNNRWKSDLMIGNDVCDLTEYLTKRTF